MYIVGLFIIALNETIQKSNNWWMDKQNTMNTTVCGNNIKGNNDICYYLGKPQKHYAKLKKSNIKDYLFYYYI